GDDLERAGFLLGRHSNRGRAESPSGEARCRAIEDRAVLVDELDVRVRAAHFPRFRDVATIARFDPEAGSRRQAEGDRDRAPGLQRTRRTLLEGEIEPTERVDRDALAFPNFQPWALARAIFGENIAPRFAARGIGEAHREELDPVLADRRGVRARLS